MDGVKQLGVFLRDGVLKRKIEQPIEEAFPFGHVGCLQSVRCIRHSFPSKMWDEFAGCAFLKSRTKWIVREAALSIAIAESATLLVASGTLQQIRSLACWSGADRRLRVCARDFVALGTGHVEDNLMWLSPRLWHTFARGGC